MPNPFNQSQFEDDARDRMPVVQPERPFATGCEGVIVLVIPLYGGQVRYQLSEEQALMLRSELAIAMQETKRCVQKISEKSPLTTD